MSGVYNEAGMASPALIIEFDMAVRDEDDEDEGEQQQQQSTQNSSSSYRAAAKKTSPTSLIISHGEDEVNTINTTTTTTTTMDKEEKNASDISGGPTSPKGSHFSTVAAIVGNLSTHSDGEKGKKVIAKGAAAAAGKCYPLDDALFAAGDGSGSNSSGSGGVGGGTAPKQNHNKGATARTHDTVLSDDGPIPLSPAVREAEPNAPAANEMSKQQQHHNRRHRHLHQDSSLQSPTTPMARGGLNMLNSQGDEDVNSFGLPPFIRTDDGGVEVAAARSPGGGRGRAAAATAAEEERMASSPTRTRRHRRQRHRGGTAAAGKELLPNGVRNFHDNADPSFTSNKNKSSPSSSVTTKGWWWRCSRKISRFFRPLWYRTLRNPSVAVLAGAMAVFAACLCVGVVLLTAGLLSQKGVAVGGLLFSGTASSGETQQPAINQQQIVVVDGGLGRLAGLEGFHLLRKAMNAIDDLQKFTLSYSSFERYHIDSTKAELMEDQRAPSVARIFAPTDDASALLRLQPLASEVIGKARAFTSRQRRFFGAEELGSGTGASGSPYLSSFNFTFSPRTVDGSFVCVGLEDGRYAHSVTEALTISDDSVSPNGFGLTVLDGDGRNGSTAYSGDFIGEFPLLNATLVAGLPQMTSYRYVNESQTSNITEIPPALRPRFYSLAHSVHSLSGLKGTPDRDNYPLIVDAANIASGVFLNGMNPLRNVSVSTVLKPMLAVRNASWYNKSRAMAPMQKATYGLVMDLYQDTIFVPYVVFAAPLHIPRSALGLWGSDSVSHTIGGFQRSRTEYRGSGDSSLDSLINSEYAFVGVASIRIPLDSLSMDFSAIAKLIESEGQSLLYASSFLSSPTVSSIKRKGSPPQLFLLRKDVVWASSIADMERPTYALLPAGEGMPPNAVDEDGVARCAMFTSRIAAQEEERVQCMHTVTTLGYGPLQAALSALPEIAAPPLPPTSTSSSAAEKLKAFITGSSETNVLFPFEKSAVFSYKNRSATAETNTTTISPDPDQSGGILTRWHVAYAVMAPRSTATDPFSPMMMSASAAGLTPYVMVLLTPLTLESDSTPSNTFNKFYVLLIVSLLCLAVVAIVVVITLRVALRPLHSIALVMSYYMYFIGEDSPSASSAHHHHAVGGETTSIADEVRMRLQDRTLSRWREVRAVEKSFWTLHDVLEKLKAYIPENLREELAAMRASKRDKGGARAASSSSRHRRKERTTARSPRGGGGARRNNNTRDGSNSVRRVGGGNTTKNLRMAESLTSLSICPSSMMSLDDFDDDDDTQQSQEMDNYYDSELGEKRSVPIPGKGARREVRGEGEGEGGLHQRESNANRNQAKNGGRDHQQRASRNPNDGVEEGSTNLFLVAENPLQPSRAVADSSRHPRDDHQNATMMIGGTSSPPPRRNPLTNVVPASSSAPTAVAASPPPAFGGAPLPPTRPPTTLSSPTAADNGGILVIAVRGEDQRSTIVGAAAAAAANSTFAVTNAGGVQNAGGRGGISGGGGGVAAASHTNTNNYNGFTSSFDMSNSQQVEGVGGQVSVGGQAVGMCSIVSLGVVLESMHGDDGDASEGGDTEGGSQFTEGASSSATSASRTFGNMASTFNNSSTNNTNNRAYPRPICFADSALVDRDITVVHINIVHFHMYARMNHGTNISRDYEEFISFIHREVRRFGGMLESFSGDKVWVSFNASSKCVNGPVAAAHYAYTVSSAINNAVIRRGALDGKAFSHPIMTNTGYEHYFRIAPYGVTCGVATGRAFVGPLGNSSVKRHTIISNAISEAAALERQALRYPGCNVLIGGDMIPAVDGYSQYLLIDATLLPGSFGRRRRVACLKGPMLGHGRDVEIVERWLSPDEISSLPKENTFRRINHAVNAFLEGNASTCRQYVAQACAESKVWTSQSYQGPRTLWERREAAELVEIIVKFLEMLVSLEVKGELYRSQMGEHHKPLPHALCCSSEDPPSESAR